MPPTSPYRCPSSGKILCPALASFDTVLCVHCSSTSSRGSRKESTQECPTPAQCPVQEHYYHRHRRCRSPLGEVALGQVAQLRTAVEMVAATQQEEGRQQLEVDLRDASKRASIHGSGSESQGADPRSVCVERSKTGGIKQRAGCCHKGIATARGPEPPRASPVPQTGTHS
eukprot:364731-Chlamydomonas_euryale.AAC.15